MMWYENNIFTGTVALTIIACWAITLVPTQAKDIVVPIVTGISGFISGYVAKSIKDAVTTTTSSITEQSSNATPPNPPTSSVDAAKVTK